MIVWQNNPPRAITEVDDFAQYSAFVNYPEGESNEQIERWFDAIYYDWKSNRGIYTSSDLLKALKELAKRGWSFTLTLSQSDRLENVPDTERLPFEGSKISWFDLTVQCMGYATRESPYFISLSQDHLTLSKHNRGLIASFTPDEIVGLQAVPPAKR